MSFMQSLHTTASFWLSLAALAAVTAPAVRAQSATPAERAFAERAAMLAADQRCNLLNPDTRRALAAFTAQARGDLLRAGVADARVALIASQARAAAGRRACADPVIRTEAARVSSAHKAWRGQMSASYPGLARRWDASRAGKDGWRAWQELGGGVRAGFVREGATGLAFAVETPSTAVSGARLHLRDPNRLGAPRAGQRLSPPLRVGTSAHLAASSRPAITKARIEAPPRAGRLLVFPPAATRAAAEADPRDTFEVEVIDRSGRPARYLVEAGDIAAAYAFAAEG